MDCYELPATRHDRARGRARDRRVRSPARRSAPSARRSTRAGSWRTRPRSAWTIRATTTRSPRTARSRIPLFSVCYEWPAVRRAARARPCASRGRSWASTRRTTSIIHRLPTAADRLLTRAQIIVVRPSRAGTLVVARLSTVDRNGRPVTTTDYGSGLPRRSRTEGETRAPIEPLVPTLADRPRPETRWSAPVPVGGSRAAHVYSECARIWNPIHTDIAVARIGRADRPRSCTAPRRSRWRCRR